MARPVHLLRAKVRVSKIFAPFPASLFQRLNIIFVDYSFLVGSYERRFLIFNFFCSVLYMIQLCVVSSAQMRKALGESVRPVEYTPDFLRRFSLLFSRLCSWKVFKSQLPGLSWGGSRSGKTHKALRTAAMRQVNFETSVWAETEFRLD